MLECHICNLLSIAAFWFHLILKWSSHCKPCIGLSWSYMSGVYKIHWFTNHASINPPAPRLWLLSNAATEAEQKFSHCQKELMEAVRSQEKKCFSSCQRLKLPPQTFSVVTRSSLITSSWSHLDTQMPTHANHWEGEYCNFFFSPVWPVVNNKKKKHVFPRTTLYAVISGKHRSEGIIFLNLFFLIDPVLTCFFYLKNKTKKLHV